MTLATRFFISLFLLLSSISIAQNNTKSPKEFLGYELGDRFTRHHEMRNYYEHVAATNTNVKLVEYGKTNEHRPLFVVIISSSENMNNLE
ncbi:MAG: zinc carboxypeptidase, partial [Cyclobacteriaceae bacterium]|nr:zinc carboxypeptidase [Cyclobacteriaceae bacterium]